MASCQSPANSTDCIDRFCPITCSSARQSPTAHVVASKVDTPTKKWSDRVQDVNAMVLAVAVRNIRDPRYLLTAVFPGNLKGYFSGRRVRHPSCWSIPGYDKITDLEINANLILMKFLGVRISESIDHTLQIINDSTVLTDNQIYLKNEKYGKEKMTFLYINATQIEIGVDEKLAAVYDHVFDKIKPDSKIYMPRLRVAVVIYGDLDILKRIMFECKLGSVVKDVCINKVNFC